MRLHLFLWQRQILKNEERFGTEDFQSSSFQKYKMNDVKGKTLFQIARFKHFLGGVSIPTSPREEKPAHCKALIQCTYLYTPFPNTGSEVDQEKKLNISRWS